MKKALICIVSLIGMNGAMALAAEAPSAKLLACNCSSYIGAYGAPTVILEAITLSSDGAINHSQHLGAWVGTQVDTEKEFDASIEKNRVVCEKAKAELQASGVCPK